jgi:hypothetical protein
MRAALRKPELVGWIILGAAMVVGGGFLLWLQRDLAYDGDSFNWLALSGIGSNNALIEPYGGHLIFLPLLLYKVVLAIAGDGYSTFAIPQIILILLLSGLIYEYGRRRVGPLLALPAAIIIIFLGSGWSVLLQPMIGIQFLCALVPGVAALLALERDDRPGDVMACIFLTLATWSFEMGLAFVVGATVGIALRKDRWRRIWIVAIPIASYGIWKIWARKYGGFDADPSNLLWFPAYMIDSLAVVGVSVLGLSYLVGGGQLTYLKYAQFELTRLGEGLMLLLVEAAGIYLVIHWMRRRGPIPATFWVALATLITLWLEQTLALGPARTPGEIRYVVPVTTVVMLVVLEVARGLRTNRVTVTLAVLLTAAAVIGNLPRFQDGRALLMEYSPNTKAAITVLVLGGDNVSLDFAAGTDAPGAFATGREPYIGTGTVQQLSAEFGPLGYSPAGLVEQGESVRRSADIVAANALALEAKPAGRRASATCRPAKDAPDAVTLPRGGAIVESRNGTTSLSLRRFADSYVFDLGPLEPGRAVILKIPGDSAGIPWHARALDAGGLAACPLPSAPGR